MIANISFCILMGLVSNAMGFNLAPNSARIVSDPLESTDSYFGYTVAMQKNPARLIVGAPGSQSSNPSQRNLRKPGVVYSCSLLTNTQPCSQITLEREGDVNRPDQKYWDRKERAWIGGALDVSDSSPHMVTCGSRWKNQLYPDYYLMNGVCYLMKDSTKINTEAEKLIPLLDRNQQSYRVDPLRSEESFYYAYGQAGFSVHMTPSYELVVGAPGVLLWTGTVIRFNNDSNSNMGLPLVPNPIFTKDLTQAGYMGYSVGSGQFLSSERLFVASAPRALSYHGQVLLFQFPADNNSPLDIRSRLQGGQMGEYFGATLAVVDFDGDGLDDLLIGAPLHSTRDAGDRGAVYVYRNAEIWNKDDTKNEGTVLIGEFAENRFGSAIGALGDLDLDGFNDVAVGAPYEGQGAIYIFRGSPKGLSLKPSQRILAFDISQAIRGFGISISRALDVDDNYYPDLAVGAHDSGHVVLVKTSPVVHLKPRLERSIRRVTLNTTQIIFEVCFYYDGRHLPDNLQVETEISVDKIHRRGTFASGTGGHLRRITFDLRLRVESCKTQIVKLTAPSSWTGAARYAAIPITMTGVLSLCTNTGSCPVVDPSSNTTLIDRVQVMATCDKDECVPVWNVTAHFPYIRDLFVLGSADAILVRVEVRNEGDSAHILRVSVTLPPSIQPRTVPSVCDRGLKDGQWSCLPGFRIDANEVRTFDLSLDVSDYNETFLQVNVTAQAFDSDVLSNASAIVHIVRIERVDIIGRASPPIAVVQRGTARGALTITHSYQAYCAGYTSVKFVSLELVVPVNLRVEKRWHSLLNVSLTGILGDVEANCSVQKPTEKMRRDIPQDFLVKRALACGGRTGDIECWKAVCEGGPLLPRSDGLQVTLKMDVSLPVLGLLLEDTYQVSLNTSATAMSFSASTAIVRGLATLLAGPVPEKQDPLLPLYIALAVVAALVLLCLLIFGLYKMGFFNRWRKPEEEEELAALSGAASPESDFGTLK